MRRTSLIYARTRGRSVLARVGGRHAIRARWIALGALALLAISLILVEVLRAVHQRVPLAKHVPAATLVPGANAEFSRLLELTADRTTHHLMSRGEISFALTVSGNVFSGTAQAVFYDADGQRIRGPLQAKLEGERVLP